MSNIVMYTTPICPYCVRAKQLLKGKGYDAIDEQDVSDPTERQKMMDLTGGMRTVPQIFINGTHVGGYDDLAALERKGELDPLLEASDS